MKQLEGLTLNDVTIKQKMEFARLTALMSKVTLQSMNMEDSHIEIDFFESAEKEAANVTPNTCIHEKAKILLKINSFDMKFQFNHWLEAESHITQEE